ncbi:hypothetical protein C2S52_021436 [Perilla frutescens var. hirtella]|nr:hypothetical protein C2S52_021436 [Perilla frutescens var. hirtella]
MKSIGEDAVDPLLCGCVLRTKCGLPCAHEIDQHVRSSTPFSLDVVDKFWRKLDMEPTGAKVDVASDIDNRWFETWTCANNMFAQANESASCSQVPDSFEVDTSLSQVLFTTRPQKQKVIHPKASHHLGIGYIDQIPAAFRGYVTRTEDVTADGHCGFRVIAGWVLGDQEAWSRVCTYLFYEIHTNLEIWDKCFLERHVVATVYNVVLVTLGGRYPTTFLPLSSTVPVDPKCIFMAAVKIREGKRANHFIQVFMKSKHPFPPISVQWKDFCMDCAAGWE